MGWDYLGLVNPNLKSFDAFDCKCKGRLAKNNDSGNDSYSQEIAEPTCKDSSESVTADVSVQ